VLAPIQDYTDRAFNVVLQFYDMNKDGDIVESVKIIRSRIMNLQNLDWKRLVAVMQQVARRSSR